MAYSRIILLLTLLHYGSLMLLKRPSTSKNTKHFRIRKGTSKIHSWTKKCDIPNIHMKKGGHKNSNCGEKMGEKRDFLPSFQYDESQEFGGGGRMMGVGKRNEGGEISAKKSGLFSPAGPMLPYPPLLNGANPMASSFFHQSRGLDEIGGSSRQDEISDGQNEGGRFADIFQQQRHQLEPPLDQPEVQRSQELSPYQSFNENSMRNTLPFARTPPSNYASNPNYIPSGIAPPEGRTMMPNGNFAGGEQLDNQLDQYMYGLQVAHSPRKSTLNIPAESFPKPSLHVPLPNIPDSDLMFPPVNPEMQDQTVVPNMPGEAMENAPPPQGEMQVAPRPLGAPFFMAQQNEMSPGNNALYRRGGMIHSNNHMESSFGKSETQFSDVMGEREKVRFRVPMMNGGGKMEPRFSDSTMIGERRRGVPRVPPDVTAINNIFSDIESDEKEYKENVDSNLRSTAAQRKDVVQRMSFNDPIPSTEPFNTRYNPQFERQFEMSRYEVPRHNFQPVGSSSMGSSRPIFEPTMPPQQRYRSSMLGHDNLRGSMYDDHIDTGNPQQNALERKYEMVLNSIAVADNFLKNQGNIDNFEASPTQRSAEGFREERPMFEESRQQFRERIPFDGHASFGERLPFRQRTTFNPFPRFRPTSFEIEDDFPMVSERKRSTIRKKTKKKTAKRKRVPYLKGRRMRKTDDKGLMSIAGKSQKFIQAYTKHIISTKVQNSKAAKTRDTVLAKLQSPTPERIRTSLPLYSQSLIVVPKSVKAAKVRYAITSKAQLAARNALIAKRRLAITKSRFDKVQLMKARKNVVV